MSITELDSIGTFGIKEVRFKVQTHGLSHLFKVFLEGQTDKGPIKVLRTVLRTVLRAASIFVSAPDRKLCME